MYPLCACVSHCIHICLTACTCASPYAHVSPCVHVSHHIHVCLTTLDDCSLPTGNNFVKFGTLLTVRKDHFTRQSCSTGHIFTTQSDGSFYWLLPFVSAANVVLAHKPRKWTLSLSSSMSTCVSGQPCHIACIPLSLSLFPPPPPPPPPNRTLPFCLTTFIRAGFLLQKYSIILSQSVVREWTSWGKCGVVCVCLLTNMWNVISIDISGNGCAHISIQTLYCNVQ